jgi:hypothetical protein
MIIYGHNTDINEIAHIYCTLQQSKFFSYIWDDSVIKSIFPTISRRPFDGNDAYSYNSLPRGRKLTNGDVSNNNNNEYKSVEGYATLPRSRQNKNNDRVNHDDEPQAEEKQNHERPDSLDTRSSSGVSSKFTEEDDDLLQRGETFS